MAKASKPIAAAVSPETAGRSAYIVTDMAPMRVAGRRVKAGERLLLTDGEAISEVMAGHVRPESLGRQPAK